MIVNRTVVMIATLGAFAAFITSHATAQSYPAKTVRYLVPMSAGSGADTIGRIVATGMAQVFGQQVILDNRTGAAGNLGADIAAKSAADGYTLFQASSTHATNVSLYRKLPYDLVRDFAPVTQLASSPSVLVVHPSLPVKSVAELVKLTRARPGEMNYASTGVGSATFLASELFKGMAGVNMVHVPYRGGGEAVTAIISGEVSVYFAPAAPILPHIRQGRVRALAATTLQRIDQLPQLPTLSESGYAGYQAGNWYGIMVPAKTPRDIVNAIRTGAVTAMNEPTTRKRLLDLGYLIVGDQPDEFAAFIKSEIATLGKIIRQTGVAVE
ncbi:MAG: tripartite tricarboxylate transporter substrate binding protein [Burkholderiales bacterium]